MILVSPTERPKIITALQRAMHDNPIDVERSSSPEQRGVDFLWRGVGQWWGVQRKELHDLLASFDDGRLTTEIAQMRAAVTMPHIIVEGPIRADNAGRLMTDGWGRSVSMSSLRNRFFSIAYEGATINYSRGIADTADLIIDAYHWSQKATHSTAATRPKPTNDWGKLSNRDYQIHLLQGLPTIGPKMAAAIIDTLGHCPLRLDATEEDLLLVPGMGPKTVRKIKSALEG